MKKANKNVVIFLIVIAILSLTNLLNIKVDGEVLKLSGISVIVGVVAFFATRKTNKTKDEGLNIKSSYDYSRDRYISDRKDQLESSMIFGIIILAISLIEIYLMMRSSFLSRIKEVGIYRAIGMKKKDIYKMFVGEIIAITSIASVLGVALMSYILYELSFIEDISDKFMVNAKTVLITLAFVYLFNLIVGLLPVKLTLRKTPAQILSRTDI